MFVLVLKNETNPKEEITIMTETCGLQNHAQKGRNTEIQVYHHKFRYLLSYCGKYRYKYNLKIVNYLVYLM